MGGPQPLDFNLNSLKWKNVANDANSLKGDFF